MSHLARGVCTEHAHLTHRAGDGRGRAVGADDVRHGPDGQLRARREARRDLPAQLDVKALFGRDGGQRLPVHVVVQHQGRDAGLELGRQGGPDGADAVGQVEADAQVAERGGAPVVDAGLDRDGLARGRARGLRIRLKRHGHGQAGRGGGRRGERGGGEEQSERANPSHGMGFCDVDRLWRMAGDVR